MSYVLVAVAAVLIVGGWLAMHAQLRRQAREARDDAAVADAAPRRDERLE